MKQNTSISEATDNNYPSKMVSNRGNYLVLFAILLLSILLKGIGFPLWVVLIFGLGMSFTLFVLSLIRGVQMEIDAKKSEVGRTL